MRSSNKSSSRRRRCAFFLSQWGKNVDETAHEEMSSLDTGEVLQKKYETKINKDREENGCFRCVEVMGLHCPSCRAENAWAFEKLA